MVRLNDFMETQETREAIQANVFAEHFGIRVEKIDYRLKSGDFKVIQRSDLFDTWFDGYDTLEFKNDGKAKYSDNLYIEYEQTFNGWVSKKASGHKLAIDQGHLLVISINEENLVFNSTDFNRMINSGEFPTRTTTRNKNGNVDGMYTRAMLIHIDIGRKLATYKFEHAS